MSWLKKVLGWFWKRNGEKITKVAEQVAVAVEEKVEAKIDEKVNKVIEKLEK